MGEYIDMITIADLRSQAEIDAEAKQRSSQRNHYIGDLTR
jgi:hypothetical protein